MDAKRGDPLHTEDLPAVSADTDGITRTRQRQATVIALLSVVSFVSGCALAKMVVMAAAHEPKRFTTAVGAAKRPDHAA